MPREARTPPENLAHDKATRSTPLGKPLVKARAAAHSFSMHLASLLSCEQIIPRMNATERWPAILELVDKLVACGKIKNADRDVVVEGLRAREESMSTGIGYGVAIPHTLSDRVSEVVAAFGRSPTGIEFDSLDAQPVRFIVLFIVPSDQFQLHLRTLAAIAKFINEPGIADRLALAADAREIQTILQTAAIRHAH